MIDAVWHDGMTMDEWREGFQRIKKTMQVDGKLLHRFLIGDLTESSILEYAARYAVAHEGFIPFFGVFVQVLWDEQVVDDEAMMEWSDSVQNNEEESQFKVLLEEEAIKKILNYLQGSDDYDSESGSGYDYDSGSESGSGSESESDSGSDSGSDSESGSKSNSESDDESNSNNSYSESDDSSSGYDSSTDSSVCNKHERY